MQKPPSPSSSTATPQPQLSLPLNVPLLARLDTKSRAHVVALLARLLLEAAQSRRGSEVADDAP